MKLTCTLLLLCFYTAATCQPRADYDKYKALAPNAEVVASAYENDIVLTLVDDKVAVNYHTREEFFYLGNNVSGYADRSIDYSKFYDLKSYEAYTRSPSGNRYKKIMVDQYKRNDFVGNDVFHDDQKELRFVLPGIEKGAKSVIETSYEITDPHMIPRFSFSPYVDYFNVVFSLTHDENIDVAIDTMNFGHISFEHKLTKKGKMVKHVWTINAPKKYSFESSGPDAHYLAAQILMRIKSYKVKGETILVLNELKDLYSWYCGFITKSTERFEAFETLADSIVGQTKDPMQQAAKIYDWVQKNVRYIAFEEGYAGLIPSKASSVCKERYGDCKGMANLLYHLLRSKDIDARICWIGTRSLPYRYSKTPAPTVDNHMITAIKTDTGFIFLDATHPNLAFGVPSPFIQGKETLVNDAECKDYTLAVVPEMPAMFNLAYDSCSIRMKGRDISGSGIAMLTGYSRMSFVDDLNDKSYKFLVKQCRYMLLKGSNKFVLDTVWLENADEKNKPLFIHYAFRIPDYVIAIDGEYYMNLNLDRVSAPSKIDMSRNVGVHYRYKNAEINVANFILDEGINAELPADEVKQSASYVFENRFVKNKNSIIRRQKWVKNNLILEPNGFAEYNNMVDAMQRSYQEQITIKTKTK